MSKYLFLLIKCIFSPGGVLPYFSVSTWGSFGVPFSPLLSFFWFHNFADWFQFGSLLDFLAWFHIGGQMGKGTYFPLFGHFVLGTMKLKHVLLKLDDIFTHKISLDPRKISESRNYYFCKYFSYFGSNILSLISKERELGVAKCFLVTMEKSRNFLYKRIHLCGKAVCIHEWFF